MASIITQINAIFIKTGNVLEKVNFDNILWIQSDGNYNMIFTANKKFVVKKSLIKMSEILPNKLFVRIHMKHIVPINKIEKIDLLENLVIIEGNKIAIGPRYRSDLLKLLNTV